MTSLTYDPETYVVEFGTDMSNLDQTSSTVTSGNDITRQNFFLSVLLEGLVPSTQYFYRVMIRNSAGEVRTCLLYTSPSPRDATLSRMPSSA